MSVSLDWEALVYENSSSTFANKNGLKNPKYQVPGIFKTSRVENFKTVYFKALPE